MALARCGRFLSCRHGLHHPTLRDLAWGTTRHKVATGTSGTRIRQKTPLPFRPLAAFTSAAQRSPTRTADQGLLVHRQLLNRENLYARRISLPDFADVWTHAYDDV